MIPKVKIKCQLCKKEVLVYPSIAVTKLYCSRLCKHKTQKGRPNLKLKGRKFPERSNENARTWKGDEASYSAVHHWVKSHFGNPMTCEDCRVTEESNRRIHWANISGKYLRERSDWKRLCVFCHKRFDNHSQKLKIAWKNGANLFGKQPKLIPKQQ